MIYRAIAAVDTQRTALRRSSETAGGWKKKGRAGRGGACVSGGGRVGPNKPVNRASNARFRLPLRGKSIPELPAPPSTPWTTKCVYPKVAVDFPRDLKKKLQLTYPELPEGEFDESQLIT